MQPQKPVLWGLAADLAQGGSGDASTSQLTRHPHGRSPEFGLESEMSQQGSQQHQRPNTKAGPSGVNGANVETHTAFVGPPIDRSSVPAKPSNLNWPMEPDPPPYGLVLELAGPSNPLDTRPAATPSRAGAHSGKRPLANNSADASWAILPPGAIPQLQQQQRRGAEHHQQSLAAAYAGVVRAEEEPDYGIVAELRQAGSFDVPNQGFGLAAEVARRRGDVPLPPGGRYGSTSGSSLPPMRPRKRLAAAGPPASFGMSQELADRQAQMERDRLDPFNEANRASARDPFFMADELVKFPTMPFKPLGHQEQEFVHGSVPLKLSPLGGDTTNTVSGDGRHYGLASELGAHEYEQQDIAGMQDATGNAGTGSSLPGPSYEEQQRRLLQELLDWEPPGDKYVYNEDTGMLQTIEGAHGVGNRVAKEFIEDGATGNFYRLRDPGMWRKMSRFFKGKPKDKEYQLDHNKGFRAFLRVFFFQVSNFYSMLGILVQLALGGFAIMNFYLTYLLPAGKPTNYFLQYYSPNAMVFARIYFALITLAVIAATAKFCHDQILGFQPTRVGLRWVDGFRILFYSIAYVTTVLCTPLDDGLQYESNRNPQFYQMTFNDQFIKRMATWHALNVLRILSCGLGLLLLCYHNSPYVFTRTINHETREKLKEILAPTLRFDPSMAMVPMTPPVLRSRTASGHRGGLSHGGAAF